MRIRIRFEKEGSLRFIGHLDIMRYFHKALQRAHVAVCFSGGYHPHPVMSFASPLGVGLTSRGEYMDVEVEETASSREMIERINATMVEGIRVTGYRLLPEDEGRKHHNAMATVGMADYLVKLKEARPSSDDKWEEEIAHFLARPEIIVTKKMKKSQEETDIRPWIYEFRREPQENAFFLRLSAGSLKNLKPELVMEAFLGEPCSRKNLAICRLDMRTAEGVSLGDLGEEIA